jgi:hypothetical protein
MTTAHPLPQTTNAIRYLLTSYGFHLLTGILLHQQTTIKDLKNKKMKKKTNYSIYGLFTIAIAFSLATSQVSAQALSASLQSSDPIIAEASTAVNTKVLNAFERSFANAESPKWEVSNNHYVAHFRLEDRQALVAFWRNGNINYTILYGTEKHLPIHEKSLVQENFSDYKITATQHVIQNNANTWIVNVENDRKFYRLKIVEDEVVILECLKKMK